MPTLGDNALLKLAPVLERLAAYAPVRRRSPELDGRARRGRAGRRVARASGSSAAALQHDELWHALPALAGSTFALTMAGASRKRNVIPAEASVEYDCRVLPGTDPERAAGRVPRGAAGLDVELELAEPPLGGTRSPLETPLRDALAEWVDELEPGALLVPEISTGFTDAHFLREAYGTIAYGFFPLRHTAPELLDTVHAPDERIDVRDLELAVRAFVHCIDRIGSVIA